MLYRDGTDAFVTGKVLDDLIQLNRFYNLAQKCKANTQEWDPRVLTTIASYGIYCVRGKLPPKFDTSRVRELPHPFHVNRGVTENDSDLDDDDDFSKRTLTAQAHL